MIELLAFLDLESTGLLHEGTPLAEQPHIVEIAVLLTTAKREVVGSFQRLIKPDGWSIHPEAEAVHGISDDLCYQAGVPIRFAIEELEATLENATVIVGHNIQGFDRRIIGAEIERLSDKGSLRSLRSLWWAKQAPKIVDTMELATPVLKLPGNYGHYKFPKLSEAVNLFPAQYLPRTDLLEWIPSHRAMDDVIHVEKIYWAIQKWRTENAASPPA